MRWNRKDKIILLQQLEMCISSGLTVIQALDSHTDSLKGRKRHDLIRAKEMFESGQPLSSALRSVVGLPESLVGLISCGEMSGSLASTLRSSHGLLEQQDELIQKVLSSMAYPVVIGVTTVLLTIGLVRGVMPQIIPLLTGLRVELPWITRAVIYVSDLVTEQGLTIFGILVLLFVNALIFYSKFRIIKKSVHTFLIRIPIFGSVIYNYHCSLFFQSCGSMISAGIPADTAYERAASAVTLLPLRQSLMGHVSSIRAGGKFKDVSMRMPAYARSLVSAGETSGNLGQSLLRITSMIEREMDHFLKKLTSLVEPLMMVGMGGAVGMIALSIMLPIYDISKTLQG